MIESLSATNFILIVSILFVFVLPIIYFIQGLIGGGWYLLKKGFSLWGKIWRIIVIGLIIDTINYIIGFFGRGYPLLIISFYIVVVIFSNILVIMLYRR